MIWANFNEANVLLQHGAADFEAAVVLIGSDTEAGGLTVLALVDFGLADTLGKASSASHARILKRIGATYVVLAYRPQNSDTP